MKQVIKRIILRILPERLLLTAKKIHYARTVRSFSENSEPDLKVVKYLVRPGDHVADIGANIGVYTKCLSEMVGVNGCVYSIEPIPLTFEILVSNIRKLNLKSVRPINCAISDSDGITTMEVPLFEYGAENFYEARIVSDSTDNSLRRVTIECKTIDIVLSESSHGISFIKCDTEGHELRCLKGSENIISSSRPAWLIEVSGEPDNPASEAHETVVLMAQKDYGIYWFDGKTLRQRRRGDNSVNYFFLADKHLELLKNNIPFAGS